MKNSTSFRWPSRQDDNPAHDMLVAFLVTDIQHSPDWTTELITQIEAVQAGELSSWKRIGNAFQLELIKEGVMLEDLIDDTNAGYVLPLAEVKSAALAWLDQM